MTIPAPSFEYVEERIFETVMDAFPSGGLHRRSRYGKPRREFTLQYRNVPQADRDALRAEHQAAKGSAGTTTYTPVDEVTPTTVRFADDEIEYRQVSGNTWEFDCRLLEEP